MPLGLLVSNCNRILIFISAGGYAEGIACYFRQDYLSPLVAFSRRPAYLGVGNCNTILVQWPSEGMGNEVRDRTARRIENSL